MKVSFTFIHQFIGAEACCVGPCTFPATRIGQLWGFAGAGQGWALILGPRTRFYPELLSLLECPHSAQTLLFTAQSLRLLRRFSP